MRRVTLLAVVSLFLLMSASTLFAGGQGGYGNNELGIFIGDTRFEGQGAFTVGGEYEYRWNTTAGIGLQFEYASSDSLSRTWILAVPFCLHPYGGLRLSFAPAVAAFDEGDDTVNRGLVRAALAYSLEAGDFTITPEFGLDFMSEHAYTVYGVRFGYGF
jgi:hypothetical protein